jgi:hypothetical protein
MNKLWSGRFIFTMVAAFAFLVLSIRGTMPIDKVHEIILVVVYAYFSRGDRNQQGGKNVQ